MTRIAILVTGRPPSTLQPDFGDYAAMFGTILGDGYETTAFDVQGGEFPDPDAFDGAIVTGSAAGVYDDLPWIAPLLDWLRTARGRTKLVGICFGHQAMAQAFGGHVEKSDKGWGIGLHTYDIVSSEPWMQPPAATIAIPVSHQDQVVRIDPDARVIARCDFTPHAGLAWGNDAISFQCHPEFVPTYAAALVEGRRGSRIPEALADEAVASLEGPDDRDLVSGWIRAFLVLPVA